MKSRARSAPNTLSLIVRSGHSPKRQPGEYRRIEVASRRVGLSLHARRGYVVLHYRLKSLEILLCLC